MLTKKQLALFKKDMEEYAKEMDKREEAFWKWIKGEDNA